MSHCNNLHSDENLYNHDSKDGKPDPWIWNHHTTTWVLQGVHTGGKCKCIQMEVIRISRGIFWLSNRLNGWWTWIPLRNVKLKTRNSGFVWPLLPAHENTRIWCQQQGTFFLTWSMLKSELLQDVYRFFSNLLFTFSSLSSWELKLSHEFQSSRTLCFCSFSLLSRSSDRCRYSYLISILLIIDRWPQDHFGVHHGPDTHHGFRLDPNLNSTQNCDRPAFKLGFCFASPH